MSTNGTCLKNNEYIQSEQEDPRNEGEIPHDIEQMSFIFLTPTFLVPTRVKNNIA